MMISTLWRPTTLGGRAFSQPEGLFEWDLSLAYEVSSFAVKSCDCGSGRRPKLKKSAQQSCTIYTGHASHVILGPRRKFTNCLQLLKLVLRVDLGPTNLQPFTASRNSSWFKSYGHRKMAKIFVFPESEESAESESKSESVSLFPKPFSGTSKCSIVFKFCIRLLQAIPWGKFFSFFEFRKNDRVLAF